MDVVERLGAETLLYCSLNFDPNESESDDGTIKSLVEDTTNMVASIDSRSSVARDDIIDVAFDAKHIHLFDKETEQTILIKDENYEEIESAPKAEAKADEKAEKQAESKADEQESKKKGDAKKPPSKK